MSITLAGSPLTPAARPAFRMHTLTVRGTTLTGKPDNGDEVFITSADNVQRFDGVQETTNFFYRGSTKFSVPAGHYWAFATFFNFNGNSASMRMVVLPQFTVAGQHTTVRVAEAAASSKVTMRTPRPSVNQQETFEVVRGARTGGPFSYSKGWSGLTAWVSPTTRKPTVGTLQTYTSGTLSSPAKVSPRLRLQPGLPRPGRAHPAAAVHGQPGHPGDRHRALLPGRPDLQRRVGRLRRDGGPARVRVRCRSSRSTCRRCRRSTSRPAATCCGPCRR